MALAAGEQPPGYFSFDVDLQGQTPTESQNEAVLQADPELASAWWIRALRVDSAWGISSGKRQIIADCDAGFYTEESDLASNLLLELRRDFADRDFPRQVSDGNYVFHGTAVATIIAGVRDDLGTNGIAYNSKLIPLQNYNYDRHLDDISKEAATVECVRYVTQLPEVGILLVNSQTSHGSAETDEPTRAAVAVAVERGITVILPAGNHSLELQSEQRHDTGSVIVGALFRDRRMANFSNFGNRVTVSAFGEQVRTLIGPRGRMDAFGGTAAAAAQVAGIVALMREANPYLSPADIRGILQQTSIRSPTNANVGGQVDAYAAVKWAAETIVPIAERRAASAAKLRVLEMLRKQKRGRHHDQ
jgi:subtilisin family serine protease